MGPDLVGVGQISLDHRVSVDVLPAAGGKARLEAAEDSPGGQIATALLAARTLGLRCALAGAVGDDAAGESALAPLVAGGVDVEGVRVLRGVPTRQAWVILERTTGERTILERRDPALVLEAPALDAGVLEAARALLVDLEHPEAALAAARRARRAGIPVLLDADRLTEEALALVREVEFPIVSEGLADEISSGTSHEQALRALVGPGTRMAVITRGARGSIASIDGRTVETAARSVDVVDTTGAGDVFRGAFAWALLGGHPLERVLELANSAAAWSCRRLGAQGALPRSEEVEDWAPARSA